MRSKPAVVLLSGGLDSAVTLYLAKQQGYKCFALAFDYGQRHRKEINAAKKIAASAGVPCQVLKIALPWKGSALLDRKMQIPGGTSCKSQVTSKIPCTYVPARNIIFLSYALSYAEALGAGAIYIGAHSQDYSGYPDCRPEFFRAFGKVVSVGTKSGSESKKIEIKTPIIKMSKAKIIKSGMKLGVPFELTWSCYRGEGRPCGVCDSCRYRAKGFKEAGFSDPAIKV